MRKIARNAVLNNQKDAIADIRRTIDSQEDALKTVTKALLATVDQDNARAMKHLASLLGDLQATRDVLRNALVGLDASEAK
jgi:hypothetical protein